MLIKNKIYDLKNILIEKTEPSGFLDNRQWRKW